jgi:hypothetical protein
MIGDTTRVAGRVAAAMGATTGLMGLLDAAMPILGMDHVPVLLRPDLGVVLVVVLGANGVMRHRTAGILCVAPLLGAWVAGNALVASWGAAAAGLLAVAGVLVAMLVDPPGPNIRWRARGLVHSAAGAVLGGPVLMRQLVDWLIPRDEPGRTWG